MLGVIYAYLTTSVLLYTSNVLLKGREGREGGEGHGVDKPPLVEAPLIESHAVWRRSYARLLFWLEHYYASLLQQCTLYMYLPTVGCLIRAYTVRASLHYIGGRLDHFSPSFTATIVGRICLYLTCCVHLSSLQQTQRGIYV